MGLPIVGTTLVQFLGNKKERNEIGFQVSNLNEIIRSVDYVISNPDKFNKVRSHALKYYEWKKIIKENLIVYDNLFEKYYGDI